MLQAKVPRRRSEFDGLEGDLLVEVMLVSPTSGQHSPSCLQEPSQSKLK